jgi:anti-sigma B factor antagonist
LTYRITEHQLADDVRVIALAGEGDLMAAPELRRRVDSAIDAGATKLVLDLSESTFIDSTALGILLGALKRLRPRGGRVAVLCPDPAIGKVFEITGLDRMMPVTSTLAEALAALHDPDSGTSEH